MADDGGKRPSFTAFWRRVKQKEKTDKTTNTSAASTSQHQQQQQQRQEQQEGEEQQNPNPKREREKAANSGISSGRGAQQSHPHPTNNDDDDPSYHEQEDQSPADKEPSAKDKAQIRRAQVRKAQIQHRQRKANYVKQLELDISQLRDLISQAQQDASKIRKENDGIKDILRAAEVSRHQSSQQQQLTAYSSVTGIPATGIGGEIPVAGTQEWLMGQQLGNLDLNLQEPVASNSDLFSHINIDDITVSLGMNDVFGAPCFTISSNSSATSLNSFANPPLSTSEGEPPFMPPMTHDQERTVVNWILALESICWDHFAPTDFHNHTPNDSEDSCNHTLMATALCMNSAPESIYTDRRQLNDPARSQPPPLFQWQTSAISLSALWGMSQFHMDPTEVTPVEIWFELAAKYPISLLFAERVLDTLLAELRSYVRCVVYGAAMERAAYENISARVLGPPPTTGAFGPTLV